MKKNGYRDQDILLLIPDNLACNPRNNDPQHLSCPSSGNLYPYSFTDYKDNDISTTLLLNLLTNRYPVYTPLSKTLQIHPAAHLTIYLSGHGGDSYFKIMDTQVVHQEFLVKQILQFVQCNREVEVLVVNDSCEAFTLF